MRISKAAYSIIKHDFGEGDFYLLQINPTWQKQYNFISGHVESEDENDFQKTIIREVEEELPPLRYERHFVVRSISDKPFKDEAFSLSAQTQTEYTLFLFQVFFIVPVQEIAFLWEDQGSPNMWFAEDELRMGKGKGGERITRFPVPQIINFLPGGLKALPDSFTSPDASRKKHAVC